MKKNVFLLFIVWLTLLSCSSSVSDWLAGVEERPLPGDIERPIGYDQSVLKQIRTCDGRPGKNYWQQFTEYDITAYLDPGNYMLTGNVRIVYHNHSPDTLKQLQLELTQNLHAEETPRLRPAEITGGVSITKVLAQQTALGDDSGYSIEGTRMLVTLPEPLIPSDTAELHIDFAFKIPQRGAGGRMGHSRDNLFYLGYWYPQMVVYDDVVGWHPDPFLGQAEFYHGFAEYRMALHAPENWIVMATGELLNADDVLAPELFERWMKARNSDEPMMVYYADDESPSTVSAAKQRKKRGETGDKDDDYLIWEFHATNVRDVAFSATREAHWEAARAPVGDLTGDGEIDYTTINTFWRVKAPLWSEVTRYQQHAISFLSEMSGFPYPWPHMTAVEGAAIIAGGMEYPMMTIMGDYNQRGEQALYSVTAHELAHMWVPLIVSTDERRYSWLDEGNTVYSTSEAMMDMFPDRQPHREAQNEYTRVARSGNEGPMMLFSDKHESSQQFIIASYRKPAAVLYALRKVLGEAVFEEAWKAFINDWAFKLAYPWDFFKTFERVSGEDLSWFWYSWYDTTWVLNQAVHEVMEVEEGTRIVIKDMGKIPMPVYLTVTYGDDHVDSFVLPVDVWFDGSQYAEKIIPVKGVRKVQIDKNRMLPDIDRQNMEWEW